ncbi:MAG: class I SAM-dependent methyltransferase [Bdellovibrionales bacterium]|nr:class I SAM-dependent methyltransferase [Bdellovibrionales bacterium]
MVFVDRESVPSLDEERQRYLEHHNDIRDPRYRAFLGRVIDPLYKRLSPPAQGLDFGSGPNPVLADLLRNAGYHVEIFDPIFAPNSGQLGRGYDFVTAVEVVEHFHFPWREFELLSRLLLPGGWLAISTYLYNDDTDFTSWHYARDATHVCFYHRQTFRWISERFPLELDESHNNVTLLRRRHDDNTSA